jgi:acetoin utilization protein AcuC
VTKPVYVFRGDALARYGFGADHPFGNDRHDVFHAELSAQSMGNVIHYATPRRCSRDDLALFHTPDHIERVARASARGEGFLDQGDTPAIAGIFEAACDVVGTTMAAADAAMTGAARRAFVPIAGLHHASRNSSAGFCVFNDCGVAIEHLRSRHGLSRIAYVDIDAHHGDGVYYGFENDPDIAFADMHEDGRYLYPGTGTALETGSGDAAGTKLNIPLPPGANDDHFMAAWSDVEAHIDAAEPEFILLQCGADSLAGDPITHLELTEEAHAFAAQRLCLLADRHCSGRIIATGGGGYNRDNLARAWTRVVQALAA